MNKLKERVRARKNDDSGDVVQVVILVAGFVIIAIVLIVWIGTASLNKGADTAQCVENAAATQYNPKLTDDYGYDVKDNSTACGGEYGWGSHGGTTVTLEDDGYAYMGGGHNFSEDDSYKSRYPQPYIEVQ